METMNVPGIEFLHEQDGKFERQVKESLIPTLKQHAEIERAYLVAVLYNGKHQSVALCLEIEGGSKEDIAKSVSEAFSEAAGRGVHLDILFLSQDQRTKVRGLANAFYIAS